MNPNVMLPLRQPIPIAAVAANPSVQQILDMHNAPTNRQDDIAFMSLLRCFNAEWGITQKIPIFDHRPLNVKALFHAVMARGGLHTVTVHKRWQAVATDLQLNPDRSDAGYRLRIHYTKILSKFEFVVSEAASQLATGPSDTNNVLTRLATMTSAEHQNAVAASIAMRNDNAKLVAAALSPAKAPRDITTLHHLSGIVASRTGNDPGCTNVAHLMPRASLCVVVGKTPPLLPPISAILGDNGDSDCVTRGKRKFSFAAPHDAGPDHRVTHDFDGPCDHTSTVHARNSNRDAQAAQFVADASATSGCADTDQDTIDLFLQRLRSDLFATEKKQ